MKGQQSIGVKAFVMREGKLLLLKRSDKYTASGTENIWDIPGGRIGFGEEPLIGLRRELLEETGLELSEVHGILDASTIHQNDEVHIVRISFLCSTVGCKVVLSEEHDSYKWIKPQDIDRTIRDKVLVKALERIDLNDNNKPIVSQNNIFNGPHFVE